MGLPCPRTPGGTLPGGSQLYISGTTRGPCQLNLAFGVPGLECLASRSSKCQVPGAQSAKPCPGRLLIILNNGREGKSGGVSDGQNLEGGHRNWRFVLGRVCDSMGQGCMCRRTGTLQNIKSPVCPVQATIITYFPNTKN